MLGCERPASKPDATPGAQVAVSDIETAPTPTKADGEYADVYKALDGTWRGEFKIYVRDDQPDGPSQPKDLEPAMWALDAFRLDQTIQVEQRYVSESPTFQRVTITDTYADGRVVTSKGVNKVQDGKMWCVVKKPDDLVIHEGSRQGEDTIIWSRNRDQPRAVEYFVETVGPKTYTIMGWGYYGADDPARAPRMFFESTYRRVEE